MAVEAKELLAELHGLRDRMPVPQPTWHPYVAQIAECRADLARALDLAAKHQGALGLVATLIEGGSGLGFDPEASADLTAAWERLEALPLPSGRHPYLEDILPALDAHRLLLVALSHTM
ncbi:MAG TPA: hypothetical protein VHC67_00555 [Gaiellaceae bacterium]|nr:hypothetical protein [Gaiellaceae bacterium]